MKRELHLTVSLRGSGYAEGSWLHPKAVPNRVNSLDYYTGLVLTAERGKMNLVYLDSAHKSYLSEPELRLDPLMLASSLIPITEHIGIGTAVNTDVNEPYPIARSLAVFDHLSNGRAAWHAKTEGEIVNLDARKGEFIQVVEKLWQSWEPDALLVDKAKGQYYNASKVHRIDHVGQFFKVRGPLCIPQPPQRKPIRIEFKENDQNADILILPAVASELAVERYDRIKKRDGETGHHTIIMTSLMPVLGRTEAAANILANELRNLGWQPEEEEVAGIFIGTPQQLADRIEELFRSYASDGFHLQPALLPMGLDDIVDELVPILQQKGLFRRSYNHGDLRYKLGFQADSSNLLLRKEGSSNE